MEVSCGHGVMGKENVQNVHELGKYTMTNVKLITIELYTQKNKRVRVENFDKKSLLAALALGKNWELLNKGNYWLSIM